jgi:hypothetical protein
MPRQYFKIFALLIVMMQIVSVDGAYGGAERPHFDKQRMHEELMALPPHERAARVKALKEEHMKRRAEHGRELEEKWQNANGEERQYFCQKLQHKCNAENKKFACEISRNKCNQ